MRSGFFIETRMQPAFQPCLEGKGLPASIRQAESERLNYGQILIAAKENT
jgi:hypothetical protein